MFVFVFAGKSVGICTCECTYMNAIPTIPSPTTTIFVLSDTGAASLDSASAPSGARLIAMPGEDVAHDILCEVYCRVLKQDPKPVPLIDQSL